MHAVEWAKAIEELTDGRLKVEIMPPGAMCGVRDIITYLERGVFQASVTAGPFYTGTIPEGDLELGLPLSHRSYDEIWDAMENRGLGDLLKEAYGEHNLEWFYCAGDPYYHFATTFPVEKLEDFKGKKIRAVGMYGKYVEALGASAVVIPGSEMYMALKLGTIDGAIYGASGLQDIKLHEVVDYYVLPTAAQVAVCLVINRDALADLPDDIERIVRGATQNILHDTGMRYIRMTKDSLNKSVRDGSVEIARLPEAELEKMRKLVAPIWEEYAQKSPRMKKGVEIIRQQMRDYGRPIE
jgi:TRAP-type C4-dicarboxylate transport system substrate-binding protein